MSSAPMIPALPEQFVPSMRRFNRFYTRQIGLLNEGLLNSPFSLTEVRTLYELAHREQSTAVELCQDLGLDAGYLSRILRKFEKYRWIEKKASDQDARQSLLSLTKEGRKIFKPLEARSTEQVRAILGKLPPAEQNDLVRAMQTIESILDPGSAETKRAGRRDLRRAGQHRSIGRADRRRGIRKAVSGAAAVADSRRGDPTAPARAATSGGRSARPPAAAALPRRHGEEVPRHVGHPLADAQLRRSSRPGAQFAWNPQLTYEQFFDGFAPAATGRTGPPRWCAVHRELEALGPGYTGGLGQTECDGYTQSGFSWFDDRRLPKPENLAKLAALAAASPTCGGRCSKKTRRRAWSESTGS